MAKKDYFDEIFSNLSKADIIAGNLRHEISETIYNKRIALGMTQEQFAKHMGVSQGMVSKWESFSYNFSLEHIAEIFSKLEIDISFKTNDTFEEYTNK